VVNSVAATARVSALIFIVVPRCVDGFSAA
jgi:hypothetical protein